MMKRSRSSVSSDYPERRRYLLMQLTYLIQLESFEC